MPPLPRASIAFACLLAPAVAWAQTAAAKPAAIPEPAALALFVLGVGVVGAAVRRRKD